MPFILRHTYKTYKDRVRPEVSFLFIIFLLMALSLKSVGILALHLLSIACTVTATNPCYFPDGNIAPEFVPCSPNGDGDCCVNGDFCTQWGFCISDSKGYHYRGACTDTTWGNPSCPRYCLADSNCESEPGPPRALGSVLNIQSNFEFLL
jgi:hypothetical protein